MLTYEKDVKPIKITAQEAFQKMKKETKIKAIVKAYEAIREAVGSGMFFTTLRFENLNTCDLVFNELVKQGYNVNLEKDMGADKVWHLSIDWSDVDLNPNKKYILPMDDTDIEASYGTEKAYAYKHDDGYWDIERFYGEWDGRPTYIIVTAKDIEEAPEWVKALEPVEVK